MGHYFDGSVKLERKRVKEFKYDNKEADSNGSKTKRGSIVSLNYFPGRHLLVTVIWRDK